MSAAPGRLDERARLDWLRLIRSENVGPQTFSALVARFGDAGRALAALPELAARGGARRHLRVASLADVETEYEQARRLGLRYVAICEPEYPPVLARIDSAPPLLLLQGLEESLQQPAVAIVGSRNASANGLIFADRLARALGEAGYVVVSGLARGIDCRAHVAALATGTIGVLAGGHAKPYPPEAVPLIPRIREHGAVVSEMPVDWEPRGRDFPRRNRLVSGLSLATVVVEAVRGSGSLITARIAAEQNREVFAVPGSPLDPRAAGTLDLLRSGAHLCTGPEDVLRELEPLRDRVPASAEQAALPFAETLDAYSTEGADGPERILGLLGPSPVAIDELARISGLAVGQLRAIMLDLELAGRVERAGGGRVSRIAAD